ncbi:hypothetical protein AAVH_08120 [Aphelenchoides avenae]|nr:hypothetical protein AAVH_08120 [Aphelenchus avenae]
MLIFIIRQLTYKVPTFHPGFYVTYCLISVVDLYYMMVTYALDRLARFGLFVDALRGFDVGATIVYESTCLCAYFQAAGHAVIALNRFTAFFTDSLHETMWRGKCLLLIELLLIAVPLPGMAFSLGHSAAYVFFDDETFSVSFKDKGINQIHEETDLLTDTSSQVSRVLKVEAGLT